MTRIQPTTRRLFLEQTTQVAAAGLVASWLDSRRAAAEPSQKAWQIGCYTRPWDKYDYRVALDAIADAGFRHVGLMTTKSKNGLVLSPASTIDEAHRIGEEVRQRGLSIPSVYGGGSTVAEFKRLVDNCAAANAKTILAAGTSNPEEYDRYYKAIAETCDYAAEKGVGIVLKPHGALNANGPQCRKVILDVVGHKNFRMWYDPGNIYYYSEGKLDPVVDVTHVDGIVTGMCVKDFKQPRSVLVTPGDGLVDFLSLFARLKKGGFTHGPLVIETLTPGNRPALLKEAKRAREHLEQVVNRAQAGGARR